MKTLKILLILLAVIFSGFSKDSQSSRAIVTVPFRFDGVIITDRSSGTACTGVPAITHARTGWLQGNQSHGGKLITGQSTWTILNCQTVSRTNTAYIEGINTVANGDSYSYICTMLTDIISFEVTLYVTVTGGTGIYEGATGEAVLKGLNTNSGQIPVYGWGSLTISK
jgi:hypothetical protein